MNDEDNIPVSDFRGISLGPAVVSALVHGRMMTGTVKNGVFVPQADEDKAELRRLTEEAARGGRESGF